MNPTETITRILSGMRPGDRSGHSHMGGSFIADRMTDGRIVLFDALTSREIGAFKSAGGAARRIVRGNRGRCSKVRLNGTLTTTDCRRVEGHSGECRFA